MTATQGGADIGTAWSDAVLATGGNPGPARASAADLQRRYGQAHRHYHNAVHVSAVLRDSADLGDALGLSEVERAVVTLAACAHDVVYDARPGADERASAQWAATALGAAGVPAAFVERVTHLVLTTLTHDADPTDTSASVLLDADLAILASAPDDYASYVTAVRAEYAAVDDDGWRTGRAAVLAGLLDRPRLYLSEPGRTRWEAPARANVTAELASLTAVS